ncbi:S-adenosylmethionine decarboxylase [Candidatus Kaiserbacteria bacterium RIFCSPHIGHO2_01_FULL_54_36]|uniref:S-adenosylmethionine decarboxylase n=1 Tax=Candidatus Kaiserbacteria bacterium RIFCSPHIGHO2_01_FULL_54_36 TaxID=1798482 RepID=A0A1F6CLT1_9BACT|nr:MAG: S-adenosylmethionine decarboxylase [Candidatus Kaiserbacteria bacterium RIFCSPHIGHO2_01_FULL_54_36]OGG75700.1 MAG: S-adenosylmethionine decarboxylase [Candidatus Kaiserbacteria bacterium RIFCSPLOWO2_01_FULL_54_22]
METRTPTDASLREEYRLVDAWGLHSGIDIHGCNPEAIRSKDMIKQFVIELCDLIEMKRFGECVVVNFGEDERVAGYSMTQLIETSLISAHFANQTNAVYLDVFSCKYYNPTVVAEFAKKFFGGKEYDLHYTVRK